MNPSNWFAQSGATSWLLTVLAVFTAFYLWIFGRAVVRRSRAHNVTPNWKTGAAGFVTAFFDTLGIGSFATTTSIFRAFRLVDDMLIPGTLNVGITLPTVVQAFLYIRLVPVEPLTLIGMIAASVLGAWLGAGVVARLNKARIQVGMGSALLIFGAILFAGLLNVIPTGGTALGLTPGKLAFAIAANFGLGALMTLGIGLYGPCMVLVSLLGLTPAAAFPIMMGSCAFLMPVASARFVKLERYDVRASIGLAIGSIPAVFLAEWWFKTLPLTAVKWLVIVVVVYTGVGLLRSAWRERAVAPAGVPTVKS